MGEMDPSALFQALQQAMHSGDEAVIRGILQQLGQFSPDELSAVVPKPTESMLADRAAGPVRPAPAGYAPMGPAPSAPNLVQPPAFDPIGSGAGLPPSVDQIKTRAPAGGPPVADTFIPKGGSQTFVKPPPGPLNVVEMPGEPVKMGAETAVRPVPKLGGALPPTLKAPPLPPAFPPLAADLEVPKTGVRPPPVSELRASGLLSESAVRPTTASAPLPPQAGMSGVSQVSGAFGAGGQADAMRQYLNMKGGQPGMAGAVGGGMGQPVEAAASAVRPTPMTAADVAGDATRVLRPLQGPQPPPTVGARVLSAIRPLASKLGTLGTAVGVGADTVGLIRAADSARDQSAAPIENFARGAAGVAGAFRPQPPPTREEMLADPAAAMRRQQSAAMGADTPIVRHLNPTAIAARAGDALSGLAQKGIEWAITRPSATPGPQFDMEADAVANMPSPFSVPLEEGGEPPPFRMSGVSDSPSQPSSSGPVRPRVKGKGGARGPSPIPSSPAMPGPSVPPGPMDDGSFRLSYSPEVMRALGMSAGGGGPGAVRPSPIPNTRGQAAPSFAGVNIAALQRPAELEGQRLPLTEGVGGGARYAPRPLDTSGILSGMHRLDLAGMMQRGNPGQGLLNDSLPSNPAPSPGVGGASGGSAAAIGPSSTAVRPSLPLSKTKAVSGDAGVVELEPLSGDDDDLEGLRPGKDSAVRNQIRRDREKKRRS